MTWSDLGVPATVTYPQKAGVGPARTVTFDLTNGWLSRVREGSTNYASSISYHPNGMVYQVARPNSTTDTFAKDANDIARPASVTVRGPLGLTLWATGTYTWDGVGNIKAMGSDTFFYDKASRLLEGKIASVSKKQCSSFDAFGNITGQAMVASSQTCTPSAWSVSSATNRFNPPVTYDAAGEQLSWNSGAYVYAWYPTGQVRQFDGSGRTTIYGYTVDGERVGTYDSYAPAGITYTLRGLDGKVLRVYRESGGVWTWVQDYVYRDGAHLATVDSSGTRHFHLDHLGTVRLITNASGSQVAMHTYLPFGQEATGTSQDAERMKFTGHERDLRDPSNTTDDLDYMHARYTNPNLGRFLSPDLLRGNPHQPQSFNLFAYVQDNPMNYVDPFGLEGDEPKNQETFDLTFFANPYLLVFVPQRIPGNVGFGFSDPWAWQHANWWSAPYVLGGSQAGGSSGGGSGAASGCASCAFSTKWWNNFKSGHYWGTGFGQGAVDYYASVILDPGASDLQLLGAYTGGLFSALWTPSTYLATYTTLLSGVAADPSLGAGVGFHGPYHEFPLLGKLPHLQFNWWQRGIGGSGRVLRLPLPPSWWKP